MSARNPPLPSPKGALVHPPPYRARRSFGWQRCIVACGLLALLPLASGCRSGDADPVPNPSAVVDENANWFCGGGGRQRRVGLRAGPGTPAPRRNAVPRARVATTRASGTVGGALGGAIRGGAPDVGGRPCEPRIGLPSGSARAAHGSPAPVLRRAARGPGQQGVARGVRDAQGAARHVGGARRTERQTVLCPPAGGFPRPRAAADEAAANLPAALSEFDPWVRRVESLQEAIRRGDALAGTSEI